MTATENVNNDSVIDEVISKEELENSLTKYFKRQSTKLISVTSGKAVGCGTLSKLIRLHLTWESDNNQHENLLPKSVIAKVRSNKNLADSDMLKNADEQTFALCFESFKPIHKNECNFYKMLGEIVPIPIPKCFFTRVDESDGTGLIIMEDMGKFTEASVLDGISLEQIYEIVNCLIKLHSWSLNTEMEWRKNFKHIYEFNGFYDYLKPLTYKMLDSLKATYPSIYDNIDNSVTDIAFDKKKIQVPTGTGVATHGDFWIHNILFDNNKVGGLVDWQFMTVGNFVDDIARMMVYSVKSDIRKDNERKIFQYYYENLKSTLKNVSILPNFEDLFASYKLRFACEAFFVVCDFCLLVEECTQQFDDETNRLKFNELLLRGASTLEDAQKILKNIHE